MKRYLRVSDNTSIHCQNICT